MKHSINYPWPVLLSVACSGAKRHYSCRDPDLINHALNKTSNAKRREVSCKKAFGLVPTSIRFMSESESWLFFFVLRPRQTETSDTLNKRKSNDLYYVCVED